MPDKEIQAIPEVEGILSTPLAIDDHNELIKQIAQGEAWLGRVSFQFRNAARILSEQKRLMLTPKSKEYTDMDRTIRLEDAVKEQQCLTDLLKDQAEILRNRISLGQSILSTHREELKRQIR